MIALIATPVVLLYHAWTSYVLRARITGEEVEPPEALAPPTGGPAAG